VVAAVTVSHLTAHNDTKISVGNIKAQQVGK